MLKLQNVIRRACFGPVGRRGLESQPKVFPMTKGTYGALCSKNDSLKKWLIPPFLTKNTENRSPSGGRSEHDMSETSLAPLDDIDKNILSFKYSRKGWTALNGPPATQVASFYVASMPSKDMPLISNVHHLQLQPKRHRGTS